MRRSILRLIKRVALGYFIFVAAMGVVYMALPPVSTLMVARWAGWQGVAQESVSLSEVNRSLLRAVVSAEDDRFCHHWGIDWRAMKSAAKEALNDDRAPGASTISMQVAKNLFLWPQRSYIRKVLEVPIALYLDLIWPKRRMMEVYLSVAEWGDGIFGAEAAAQAYFRKSASALTEREASLLVAALPNPLERNPTRPASYQRDYANTILRRMAAGPDISCLKR